MVETQYYPDELFEKNFPAWEKLILSDKDMTAEKIIKKAEQRGVFTPDQRKVLMMVGKVGK